MRVLRDREIPEGDYSILITRPVAALPECHSVPSTSIRILTALASAKCSLNNLIQNKTEQEDVNLRSVLLGIQF
jgi:hypothetical protein